MFTQWLLEHLAHGDMGVAEADEPVAFGLEVRPQASPYVQLVFSGWQVRGCWQQVGCLGRYAARV
jgi:hypothetical protein